MKLRPFHEHELLQNYSSHIGPTLMRADWYCQRCGEEVKGPPWQLGEYTIDFVSTYAQANKTTHPWLWRVHMLSNWQNGHRDVPVFETPRKREAIAHARELERTRKEIQAELRYLKKVLRERGETA
jgi:hypothetical protein